MLTVYTFVGGFFSSLQLPPPCSVSSQGDDNGRYLKVKGKKLILAWSKKKLADNYRARMLKGLTPLWVFSGRNQHWVPPNPKFRYLSAVQTSENINYLLVLPSCEHPSLQQSFICHDTIEDSNGAFHIILHHHHCSADPLSLIWKVLTQSSLNENGKNCKKKSHCLWTLTVSTSRQTITRRLNIEKRRVVNFFPKKFPNLFVFSIWIANFV
jgi:hypothetical protein